MQVKGVTVKGISHVGSPNLNTIGNVIARYDYRFGATTRNVSSQTRILSLKDLGPNGFDMSGTILPGDTCPQLFSDGIGSNGSSGGVLKYLGSSLNLLTPLHDGTAHFMYFVAWANNPTNVAQAIQTIATSNTGSPGVTFQPDITGTNNRVSQGLLNNSGGAVGQQFSPAGSLTEDSTFRLYTFTWYQNGGTNNSRITIGGNSYSASRTLTMGTNPPNRFLLFNMPSMTLDLVRFKNFGAYNLSGKTAAQIDAFVTTFNTILKQDSEYSGLVTI